MLGEDERKACRASGPRLISFSRGARRHRIGPSAATAAHAPNIRESLGGLVMPIHDWTKVFDGAFHDFHTCWIAELRTALNEGVLPPAYYAMAEQVARPTMPDVLTLKATDGSGDSGWSGEPVPGAIGRGYRAASSAAKHPRAEFEPFTRRQKSLVIRHSSDDRVVALIEIVSAGNKSSKGEFRAFVAKAVGILSQGYHLLLVNLHPRTNRDPDGIHPAIWAEVGGPDIPIPADKPLTLASYDAEPPPTAYVEPVAVGDPLISMPLFLAPGWYVLVPLEATYDAAYRGVPRRFREMLDPTARHH